MPRSRQSGGGAICTVAALFFLAQAMTARAIDFAYERAVEMALASPVLPAEIVENARDACDTALCFAKTLARDMPKRVRVERVAHPDTDTIRWATTSSSLITERTDDTLKLKITQFGRKAVTELREALTGTGDDMALELDLAGNQGGDFERMLEIAGLLLGPRRNVVEIDHGAHIERRSLKGPAKRDWRVQRVTIDDGTASAARLLADMLSAHGGAALSGRSVDDGQIFLKHRISIHHDWRLVLPVAALRLAAP